MCGIIGLFKIGSAGNTEGMSLVEPLKCITHRGPDDQGLFYEANVALGQCRLSILDLGPAGHQPMISHDRNYVMIYNGEVYNFRELRSILESKGYKFEGQCDSEVILAAFVEWGDESFKMFNGMFALAIYDRKRRKLTLARDRFGIKPLYYYNDGINFIFASEIKSILATQLIHRKINYQALSEYIWYGNALGENTLFSNIYRLLPGNILQIENNQISQEKFYDFSQIAIRYQKEAVVVENIGRLLENSVKRHLISDVPVGVFLSGGIDSSAITAFAARHSASKVQTFSVGFDFDNGVNELPKAARAGCEEI